MNPIVRITGNIHSNLVHERRVKKLFDNITKILPQDTTTLLDVGCGDGLLSSLLQTELPTMNLRGIDVLVRPDAKIRVDSFDGIQFPFDDKSFDAVMFIDVLHHTDDPSVLIAEAARVARKSVIIKDHVKKGKLSEAILRFMDWVGNRNHGVALPYNYMTVPQMASYVANCGLEEETRINHLGIYPFPASLVFDGDLHFISLYKFRTIP